MKLEKLNDNYIKYKLEEYSKDSTKDTFTKNLEKAIYIMRDGSLISGKYDHGNRTEDHRIIECLFGDINRYSTHFWEIATFATDMIMIVPETKTIMWVKGQDITVDQLHVLNELEELGYEYEDYADISVINGLDDRFIFYKEKSFNNGIYSYNNKITFVYTNVIFEI